MNRNWTSKLVIKLVFVYISWKKACSHPFYVLATRQSWCVLKKWKQNTWRGMCERVFFHERTGCYVTTSIQIKSFADNFQEFQLNKHLRMATFRSWTKCLKSTYEIVFYCICCLKSCNLCIKWAGSQGAL